MCCINKCSLKDKKKRKKKKPNHRHIKIVTMTTTMFNRLAKHYMVGVDVECEYVKWQQHLIGSTGIDTGTDSLTVCTCKRSSLGTDEQCNLCVCFGDISKEKTKKQMETQQLAEVLGNLKQLLVLQKKKENKLIVVGYYSWPKAWKWHLKAKDFFLNSFPYFSAFKSKKKYEFFALKRMAKYVGMEYGFHLHMKKKEDHIIWVSNIPTYIIDHYNALVWITIQLSHTNHVAEVGGP